MQLAENSSSSLFSVMDLSTQAYMPVLYRNSARGVVIA